MANGKRFGGIKRKTLRVALALDDSAQFAASTTTQSASGLTANDQQREVDAIGVRQLAVAESLLLRRKIGRKLSEQPVLKHPSGRIWP